MKVYATIRTKTGAIKAKLTTTQNEKYYKNRGYRWREVLTWLTIDNRWLFGGCSWRVNGQKQAIKFVEKYCTDNGYFIKIEV